MNTLTYIWIGLLVAFLVVEACTVQLVSIWFAVGSLCALVANLFETTPALQLTIFLVASMVCLLITRPLVKKFTASKIIKTNADRCIGETAVVTEEINNLSAKGQVKVNGNVWSARAEDGNVIPEGAEVLIKRMEGVKLIVHIKEKV